jgi:sugar phosphate isomerase/epimerase
MKIEIIKGTENPVAEFFSSPYNTPETDEQFKSFPAYFEIDLFCRKLERERDEAREALASREVVIAQHSVITDLILERDEWAAMCGRYKQERDIAEADATNFHARIIELIAERDNMKHERNEARQQIDQYRDKLDLTPINWDI